MRKSLQPDFVPKRTVVRSSHAKLVVGVYVGFFALLAVSYAISPASRSMQDFINLLKQSSGLGMLAIGQTLIILTGGIDLCLGSIVTFVHVLTIGTMDGDPNRILPVFLLGIAVGAGANARHSIGTGIIGGMIGETTLAMLYVPLFFYLFDRLHERGQAKKKGLPPPGAKEEAAAPSDSMPPGRIEET